MTVALLGRSSYAQLGNTFTNWIEHPAIAYRSRPWPTRSPH